MSDEIRKIFVFELGGEDYGIDVLDVKEITKVNEKEITKIPESSDFIRGLTNLRGKVIPVIDLKSRFEIQGGSEEFIIIIELKGSVAGIIADDVEEVMDINPKRIKDAPELLKNDIHDDYVREVALLENDRMITILNLESGFTEEEATQVGEMGGEEQEEEQVKEVTEEEINEKVQERIS